MKNIIPTYQTLSASMMQVECCCCCCSQLRATTLEFGTSSM